MRTESAELRETGGVRHLLRRPRWIVATLVVTIACVVFAALGNWQLRRLEERRIENQVFEARLAAEPIDIWAAVAGAGADVESLDRRPVTATGVFIADDEVLVRSQVDDGRPGFHLVTPLLTDEGTVLVNRGWVPLAAERPPVTEVPPPVGVVTVGGLARTSQDPAAIGPAEPPGRLETVARIDLDRLSEQFERLAPIWLQETTPSTDQLPVRLDLPDTDDEGPHLAYSIQWFSFAVITSVGYGLLVRRSIR